MKFEELIPKCYLESEDFRVFCELYDLEDSVLSYKTDNLIDILDPLKCPSHLLKHLGNTMGFYYDDRFYPAFIRYILLYFPDMIGLRGSLSGVTLAGNVNQMQHLINRYTIDKEIDKDGKETDTLKYGTDGKPLRTDPVLQDRLEYKHVLNCACTVKSEPGMGYIDLVYHKEIEFPTVDAVIDYVRPLGMYLFVRDGVKLDVNEMIVLDPRLDLPDPEENDRFWPPDPSSYTVVEEARGETLPPPDSNLPPLEKIDKKDMSPNLTSTAEYNRVDYASLQPEDPENTKPGVATIWDEQKTYYKGNPDYTEVPPDKELDRKVTSNEYPRYYEKRLDRKKGFTPKAGRDDTSPPSANNKADKNREMGLRTLWTLQLANNNEAVAALFPKVFSLGYNPLKDGEGNTYIPAKNKAGKVILADGKVYTDGNKKQDADGETGIYPRYNTRFDANLMGAKEIEMFGETLPNELRDDITYMASNHTGFNTENVEVITESGSVSTKLRQTTVNDFARTRIGNIDGISIEASIDGPNMSIDKPIAELGEFRLGVFKLTDTGTPLPKSYKTMKPLDAEAADKYGSATNVKDNIETTENLNTITNKDKRIVETGISFKEVNVLKKEDYIDRLSSQGAVLKDDGTVKDYSGKETP